MINSKLEELVFLLNLSLLGDLKIIRDLDTHGSVLLTKDKQDVAYVRPLDKYPRIGYPVGILEVLLEPKMLAGLLYNIPIEKFYTINGEWIIAIVDKYRLSLRQKR